MRFNLDEYVTVHERVERFYAKYPQGRITTTILEHDAETGFVLMRAEVYRDGDDALPAATGHAYELRSSGHVQQGSYVEVCETSSVGRALALLGFEVKRGIASREEMQKAARKQQPERAAAPPEKPAPPPEKAARPSPPPAPAQAAPAAPADDSSPDLDTQILQAADELGYDAAKVRKWVNQKFEVTGGLGSLTDHDKREVLKIFREQARPAPARAARK
jgi:pyruvate/2-oxoglutarate dehydrogenase complex dihydrolipoamide acyltransferase (E2) component